MIEGLLFKDGLSKASPATIEPNGHRIRFLEGTEEVFSIATADITVSDRLGQIPRRLTLSNGWVFETLDNDGVDKLLALTQPSRIWRIEGSLKAIALMLMVTGALLFSLYQWLLPGLLAYLADRTPDAFQNSLAESSIAGLERLELFSSTRLAAEKIALADRASQHTQSLTKRALTIHVKSSRLGANAFAFAGNHIIVTDEAVDLLQDESKLLAVLLHEAGHIEHRHALQKFMRQSIFGLAIFLVSGDLFGSSLPLLFIESSYSKEEELAADDFAARLLKENGLSPMLLADALNLLESHKPGQGGSTLLSTHPELTERVERLQNMAKN